jgi:chitinase
MYVRCLHFLPSYRFGIGAFLLALICPSLNAQARSGHDTLTQVTRLPQPHRMLVGYFPQWGLYSDSPYTVKALVQSRGAAMLDQINYAQGFVTNGHCSIADPNADVNYTFAPDSSVTGQADDPNAPLRGYFHQLLELKRMYPKVKVLISLEGRAADFAADAQPEQRTAFVRSCVDLFVKGNLGPGVSVTGLFDGIDVDWEFPRGADAANFVPLIEEFRKQMDAVRPGLLLSVALGPSPHMYGDADLARVGALVDEAGLMTYDFNGPWSSTTGFIAPLTSNSPDGGSVERSVTAWKTAGIPTQKLLIGLPFYGYGWRQVATGNHGFGQDGMPIHGDRPYRFIQSLIVPTAQQAGAEAQVANTTVVYRDPVSQAPWLFDGSSFWTYEDPVSIRSKATYAAREQLAGFMVWELSGDTPDAELLKAAHAALIQGSGAEVRDSGNSAGAP